MNIKLDDYNRLVEILNEVKEIKDRNDIHSLSINCSTMDDYTALICENKDKSRLWLFKAKYTDGFKIVADERKDYGKI